VWRSIAVRSGFGALGAVYFAIGVVSVRVGLLGAGLHEQGLPAALRLLLAQPKGAWLLGAVVAGLAAIALSHGVEAGVGRRRTPLSRIGLAFNAIGYAALALTAARLLLHVSAGGPSLQRASVSWLLEESWGPLVVEIVGIAVAIGGLFELYQGILGRLSFRRDLLPRRLGLLLAAICRFGLAARGLILCALGYFLVLAAEELDPKRVKTVGGALRALSQTALGPSLAGAVGLGLCAYGVYLWTLMILKRRV
jgi:hypothetical protein